MQIKKSKNVYSLLNAISAVLLTLTNGILGMIVSKGIITTYGSDFNGLNSTANQIINVLLVLEGGFTIASNVALFTPLNKNDTNEINGVLSSTNKKFKLIGAIFLALGVLISFGYAFIVNSMLSWEFVVTIMLMTLMPQAVNLFFSTTYRVLLQAEQKEYVINLITTLTITLGHIANLIVIFKNGPMWLIRFDTMVFAFINSILIIIFVRTRNKYIDLKVPPMNDKIVGTKDVFIQKITGVIYSAAPIVFLSISPAGGTKLASVYAVYGNIFILIKSLLRGFEDAPRLSLGQYVSEKDSDSVWNIFKQYELISFILVFIFICVTSALIMPFISLYTSGFDDVNYYEPLVAYLMAAIAIFELVHIPSGHLINMSGRFKVSKNFQLISCGVMLISMIVGGLIWGIYGLLFSILLTAMILAFCEIGYVHKIYFKNKLKYFLRLILPVSIAGIGLIVGQYFINININSYWLFILFGFVFFLADSLIILLIAFIFNRKDFVDIINRIKGIISKKIN